jgi:hypothetical protein
VVLGRELRTHRVIEERDDVLTDPSDVQAVYDAVPATERHLHWVTGTTRRWDGYLEFQRRPEPILEWFAKFLN